MDPGGGRGLGRGVRADREGESDAAAENEEHAPACWRGTVLSAEQRAYDTTVLHVAVNPQDPPLEYLPGQSVALEIPQRPRLWRYYSPANAPAGDGLMEFHLRWITAVRSPRPGGPRADGLRIGSPAGR